MVIFAVDLCALALVLWVAACGTAAGGGGDLHEDGSDCLVTVDCEASRDLVDGLPEGARWISVPGGTFQMGCSPDEDSCYPNEDPVHGVSISAFELLETEVTEAQFEAVMKANPSCNHSGGGGPDNPVECVDWRQAKAFCEAVGGRLPTEAEWEYAARGGTSTRFYCGDDYACLDGIAWFEDNSGERKQPVGGKAPNAFGLHDMLGNVFEWTGDLYGEYGTEVQVDPQGPETGKDRVFRGGSFYAYSPYGLRVSFRLKATETYDDGHLGVRCAR